MAQSAPQPTSAPATPQRRSQAVAARRGLVLAAMTLVVPGSAQIAAGNRRLGAVALRIWLGLIAVVLLVALGLLVARNAVIAVYATPITLVVLQWATAALGIGWMLLVVDAWRIANPVGMSTPGRLVTGVVTLALVASAGAVTWSMSSGFGAQASSISEIFVGGGSSKASNGRYNVLLLGGDAGKGREGLRPDSMTVASIDADTGRTVLFSLPRNMQWVPFPEDNPLHEKYPNGYWCASQECLLNAVYTLAESNRDLFGDSAPKYLGAEVTADVIGEILGLEINYWVMVDMAGFADIIDAMGGIRLDISKRIPMGSSHGKSGVFGYIEPGEDVLLDGYHALWFARSREADNDYERMARQKCVMNAMLRQLDPATVLTKFNDLATATKKVAATNMGGGDLGTMVELALKAKSLPMASVSMTPPLVRPVKPDFPGILEIVNEAIAKSEALDDPQSPATPQDEPSSSSSPSSSASTKGTAKKTDDLDVVCKVSG